MASRLVQMTLFGKRAVVQEPPSDLDEEILRATKTDNAKAKPLGKKVSAGPSAKRAKVANESVINVEEEEEGAKAKGVMMKEKDLAAEDAQDGGTQMRENTLGQHEQTAEKNDVDEKSDGHRICAPQWPGTLLPPESLHRCKHCKQVLGPNARGAKVSRKSPPTFACGGCNSKATTLNHLFGKWPLDEFQLLTDNEKAEFFASSGTDRVGLKNAVERQVIKKIISQKHNSIEGNFMPEWWWVNQGMPAAVVDEMKKTAPRERHPVLGDTYQIMIHGSGEKSIEEKVSQHMAKLLENGQRKRAQVAHDDAAGVDVATGDEAEQQSDDDSSSSSSSTSSSSSSRKKKSKKGKSRKGSKQDTHRSKKHTGGRKKPEKSSAQERKAQKMSALKQHQDALKSYRAIHADSAKIVSKLTPRADVLAGRFRGRERPPRPQGHQH